MNNKVGRPRSKDKKTRVDVYIDSDLLKRIDRESKKWGKSRSQIIARVLSNDNWPEQF